MRLPKHYRLFPCILLALCAAPAHAYLDPGTGSYLIQILISGLLAGAVFFRSGWAWVKHKLSFLKRGSKNDDAP